MTEDPREKFDVPPFAILFLVSEKERLMFHLSFQQYKWNLPFYLAAALSAGFIFLIPMNEDVAFTPLKGSSSSMRFTRSGMDRVISIPIRFSKRAQSYLPPLPDFHWDDIPATVAFRQALPELYSTNGFARKRLLCFARFINISRIQQLESRTFYFNLQYNSADFTRAQIVPLMHRAAKSFCKVLGERKIHCTPEGQPVMRAAGDPVWRLFFGFSKTLIVILPLAILFLSLLLIRRKKETTPLPATIISALVYGFYLGAHFMLQGKLFVPFLLLLALLLFAVLALYRNSLTTVLRSAGKLFLIWILLLLPLLAVQHEEIFSPQFHQLSTTDSRISQRISVTFRKTNRRKEQPYSWQALPGTTLFMKKILLKEQGMRSTRMLRVYLANPQYRCFVSSEGPETPPGRDTHFVMEFDSKTITAGGKRKIPDGYFKFMFQYFLESYARLLADMGGSLTALGKLYRKSDLPRVPYPLRTRAHIVLLVLLLLFGLIFSAKRKARP